MYTNPFATRILRETLTGALPLEEAAPKLVSIITNPLDPANRLKRAATRKCWQCGAKYRSTVSILCEDGLCDACHANPKLPPALEGCNPCRFGK